MPTYRIECKWSIYYTIEVPGASFEDALEKLCNKELMASYGGMFDSGTFGLDDDEMERIGAKVVCVTADGDPSPARPQACTWEYTYEQSKSCPSRRRIARKD